MAHIATQPFIELPEFNQPAPAKAADLVPALEESVATARKLLGGMDDEALAVTWKVMNGGQEVMAMPRGAVLRAIMLNHWYHHRGQLSVYLRLLGVPVPSIYGLERRRKSIHSGAPRLGGGGRLKEDAHGEPIRACGIECDRSGEG